jgi:hypothetical protein
LAKVLADPEKLAKYNEMADMNGLPRFEP